MIEFPERLVIDLFVRADLFVGWLFSRGPLDFFSACRAYNQLVARTKKHLALASGVRLVASDGTVIAYWFDDSRDARLWNERIGQPLGAKGSELRTTEGTRDDGTISGVPLRSLVDLQQRYRQEIKRASLQQLTQVSHATTSTSPPKPARARKGSKAPRGSKREPPSAEPEGQPAARRSHARAFPAASGERCGNCGKRIGPRNLVTIGGCESCKPVAP